MARAETIDGQRWTSAISGLQSPSNPVSDPTVNLESSVDTEEQDQAVSNDSGVESDYSDPQSPISETKSLLRDVSFGRIELLSPWFPEVDPSHQKARGWRTWHSKRQNLLLFAVVTAWIILLANAACLIAFVAKFGRKPRRGLIPLFEGDCNKVKNFGLIAHACINILSTLLLGASNLCMQLLAAPTRDEVDNAHRQRIWLDIGVPSWRNISYISVRRRFLWVSLGLSSIPLHFIYNSAVSTSTAQYGYATVVASESFLHGADVGNWTEITTVGATDYNTWPPIDSWNNSEAFRYIQANATNPSLFEKLSNRACLEKYQDTFTKRTNLVVVLEDLPSDPKNASVHQYIYWPAQFGGWSGYNPCDSEVGGLPHNLSEYQDLGMVHSDISCQCLSCDSDEQFEQWTRFNRTVQYCLSEYAHGDHCRINYSPDVFIAICCVSFVKCVCILVTLTSCHQPALCTIGDAIASFLEVPDHTTVHMGPVTKSMFKSPKSRVWSEDSTLLWFPRPQRWSRGPSRRRWVFTISLCIIAIAAALGSAIPGALGTKQRNPGKTLAWDMKQGFGQTDPDAWTGYFLQRYGAKGLFQNILWANLWQVIISFLYLAYNSLLTCMLVNDEWSRYATERKSLRVTHPRGIQRSTYFLSLPYKYAIPLMAANTTLHWLISQSIFIVSITTFYPNYVETVDSRMSTMSYTVVGYNTKSTIISIIFGICLVFTIIAVSWFKTMSGGIPLASTCSAAISAACHGPEEDTDASLLPVQWGVITAGDETLVRCSFTTLRNLRSPRFGEEIRGKKVVDAVG